MTSAFFAALKHECLSVGSFTAAADVERRKLAVRIVKELLPVVY